MSDTTETPQPSAPPDKKPTDSSRRRFFRRAAIVTAGRHATWATTAPGAAS